MALVHFQKTVTNATSGKSFTVVECGRSVRIGYSGRSLARSTDPKHVTCPKCCSGLNIPVPAAPESANPTAVCACCFRTQKVKPNGTMFKHGYERPGYGYIIGGCPGEEFPPYSLYPTGVAMK